MHPAAGPKIVQFDNKYAADFAALNYEWIEHYFSIEDHDREILDDPNNYIIAKGGLIIFAVSDYKVLGTAALIPLEDNTYELAKMAVRLGERNKGVGNQILSACIELAKSDGKRKIILESNTILAAAIFLYKKFGFVEIPLDKNSQYSRVNIRMELVIR